VFIQKDHGKYHFQIRNTIRPDLNVMVVKTRKHGKRNGHLPRFVPMSSLSIAARADTSAFTCSPCGLAAGKLGVAVVVVELEATSYLTFVSFFPLQDGWISRSPGL
jgi:hypothetical protein